MDSNAIAERDVAAPQTPEPFEPVQFAESTGQAAGMAPRKKLDEFGQKMELKMSMFKDDLVDFTRNALSLAGMPNSGQDSPNIGPAVPPELEKSLRDLEGLQAYFTRLERMLSRYKTLTTDLNATELQLAQMFQEQGYQREEGGPNGLAESYLDVSQLMTSSAQATKNQLMPAVDSLYDFVVTFLKKALSDAGDSAHRERVLRREVAFYERKQAEAERKLALLRNDGSNDISPTSPTANAIATFLSGFKQPMNEAQHRQAVAALTNDAELARQETISHQERHRLAVKEVIEKVQLLALKRDTDLEKWLKKLKGGLESGR
jgi:hypothetical protein